MAAASARAPRCPQAVGHPAPWCLMLTSCLRLPRSNKGTYKCSTAKGTSGSTGPTHLLQKTRCQHQPLLQLLFQARSHLDTSALDVGRGLQNLGRPWLGKSHHPGPEKQRRFRKCIRSCEVCSLAVWICSAIRPIFHHLCRCRH